MMVSKTTDSSLLHSNENSFAEHSILLENSLTTLDDELRDFVTFQTSALLQCSTREDKKPEDRSTPITSTHQTKKEKLDLQNNTTGKNKKTKPSKVVQHQRVEKVEPKIQISKRDFVRYKKSRQAHDMAKAVQLSSSINLITRHISLYNSSERRLREKNKAIAKAQARLAARQEHEVERS